jgi:hypothetical protein
MIASRSNYPTKYISGNMVISKSKTHDNYWIAENMDTGKFHTINTDGSFMVKRYPVDTVLIP